MARLDAELVTVTIPSGQSLSGPAKIGLSQIVGVDLPALTSAAITFQISVDGTVWHDAFDAAGSEVSLGVASAGNRFVAAPASVQAAPFVKVRSGTSGTPVNQGADRVITLVLK